MTSPQRRTPRPKGTFARLNLVILVLLFGGAAAYLVWQAAVFLTHDSYLTAVIALGIAVFSSGFAFQMAYVLWGHPNPRTHYGAEGTLVRTPKIVDVAFVTSFASGVSAATLYLACSPFDLVDYTPTGVLRVGVPAFCGFLILFGIPALYRTFKYGAESHIRLDAEGFEVWNGHWGSYVRGAWAQVEEILDHPVRGRAIRREVIVFALPSGRSATLVCDGMTTDSGGLRNWVRFYWQHPEFRGELNDRRALQRLDDRKFTVD